MSALQGRIALVTGGSSGIGLAIARGLARAGATAVIISRNREGLDRAIAATESAARGNLVPETADIRNPDEVRRAVAAVVGRFGRIDILVNAAGVSMAELQPLQEIEVDEWRRILSTNLDGTFLCCREVLPVMRRADSGYILNLLSTGAFRSLAGNSLYSASKFGVRALTESLIEENRRSGIRIASISPGAVDTDIWSHKKRAVDPEERATMLKADEIAAIALFLLTLPPNVHIPDITVTPWLR
jgi:NAD(P)-dependent dehydrogenase (short-subunit alcohol dehydrogenase family)